MSTWTIIIIIAVVLLFLFIRSKAFKRGDLYLIKKIKNDPDAVFRWANSRPNQCLIVSSPYGHMGVDKEEYVGPYKVTVPSLGGETIKLFIKRDSMEDAIEALKER